MKLTEDDPADLEAINSGLAELLGDDELTAEEVGTVGTPAYWLELGSIYARLTQPA